MASIENNDQKKLTIAAISPIGGPLLRSDSDAANTTVSELTAMAVLLKEFGKPAVAPLRAVCSRNTGENGREKMLFEALRPSVIAAVNGLGRRAFASIDSLRDKCAQKCGRPIKGWVALLVRQLLRKHRWCESEFGLPAATNKPSIPSWPLWLRASYRVCEI